MPFLVILIFNVNKTIPPAYFVSGVWRHSKDPTGAAQKLFIADTWFHNSLSHGYPRVPKDIQFIL